MPCFILSAIEITTFIIDNHWPNLVEEYTYIKMHLNYFFLKIIIHGLVCTILKNPVRYIRLINKIFCNEKSPTHSFVIQKSGIVHKIQ